MRNGYILKGLFATVVYAFYGYNYFIGTMEFRAVHLPSVLVLVFSISLVYEEIKERKTNKKQRSQLETLIDLFFISSTIIVSIEIILSIIFVGVY